MADKPSVTVKPKRPPLPPLQETFQTPEIFASDVANVALMQGNVLVTLANIRIGDTSGSQPAKPQRIVAGRLILTAAAAQQLVNNIQGLVARVKASSPPEPKAP